MISIYLSDVTKEIMDYLFKILNWDVSTRDTGFGRGHVVPLSKAKPWIFRPRAYVLNLLFLSCYFQPGKYFFILLYRSKASSLILLLSSFSSCELLTIASATR